jgi:dTDP-4-dehydrorhamnose reductase
MKIVLFGRGGQVGGELVPRLPACGDVVAWDVEDASFERPADSRRSLTTNLPV